MELGSLGHSIHLPHVTNTPWAPTVYQGHIRKCSWLFKGSLQSAVNMSWRMMRWMDIVIVHLMFKVEDASGSILLNPPPLYNHLVRAPRGPDVMTVFNTLDTSGWYVSSPSFCSCGKCCTQRLTQALQNGLWASLGNSTDSSSQPSLACPPLSTKLLS